MILNRYYIMFTFTTFGYTVSYNISNEHLSTVS
jgi:hypothetical protein